LRHHGSLANLVEVELDAVLTNVLRFVVVLSGGGDQVGTVSGKGGEVVLLEGRQCLFNSSGSVVPVDQDLVFLSE